MICSICHQDFDTSGCDAKGFKETKIQQNSSDGKYYCMKCAMKKYNDELKITVKEWRRNINMREIGSLEELDSVIDKLGEPEFIQEYITGKNKCDI